MLRIRDLHVSYGDHRVLRGIDLSVSAGQVVGLVGPNGCGKSTFLKAVSRVIPTEHGTISVGESDTAHLSRRDLAQFIATVPQDPILPVGYTALEVALMGRTPHLDFLQQESPDDRRCAGEALSRVGCEELADRRVDELSGGERQNVVLARALAQETPVLLLDEPTAHLDIGHQMSVFRLVRELAQERHIAALAAIHDLTLAALYCDTIALMHQGRIVENGLPDEVLTAKAIARAYGAHVRVILDEALDAPVIVPYA